MEETWLVIISLFAIIILTLMYKPPQIREGFLKKIKKAFEKPIKDVKKVTTKEFNKAKKETTKGFNVVKKETTKGFNVVKKGTDKLGKDITKGFTDIFKEIKKIIDYIVCGFNKIKTLPKCFFWYFLDIIYGTFYLFYSMLAFAVPPLKDAAKLLGEGIKMADNLINDMTGIHINRYPEDVMNMCYLCKPKEKKKKSKSQKKKPETPKKKCFT
jgi:hypothetical protein